MRITSNRSATGKKYNKRYKNEKTNQGVAGATSCGKLAANYKTRRRQQAGEARQTTPEPNTLITVHFYA